MFAAIFGEAWSLPEFGSCLKPNNHNQVKLVQIPDIHCRKKPIANNQLDKNEVINRDMK